MTLFSDDSAVQIQEPFLGRLRSALGGALFSRLMVAVLVLAATWWPDYGPWHFVVHEVGTLVALLLPVAWRGHTATSTPTAGVSPPAWRREGGWVFYLASSSIRYAGSRAPNAPFYAWTSIDLAVCLLFCMLLGGTVRTPAMLGVTVVTALVGVIAWHDGPNYGIRLAGVAIVLVAVVIRGWWPPPEVDSTTMPAVASK